MGEEDDLCPGILGGAEGLHHIAGSAGVGDEEDHVFRAHEAGGEQLEVTVAGGAELGGQAGKAGADVVGQQHTAALPKAEHLFRFQHHRHGLFHRVGGESVLGAVDGGEEEGMGVLAEGSGGSVGAELLLVEHRAGGVGLCQRNAHLVVALKTQCPAEAEDRGLGHVALLGQRRDGEVLGFVCVVGEILGHQPPGFRQIVLALVEQIPKVC